MADREQFSEQQNLFQKNKGFDIVKLYLYLNTEIGLVNFLC